MDWDFLKGLLKLFLGGLLFFGGLIGLLYNIAGGFEVAFGFLTLLLMLSGGLLVILTLFPPHS